ncbi:dTMP kinase [Zavarzinia compransoris]|uniref:Thymidylate kinase n=1 Tax=Zavarzinia compransoris TaxID=1264899 RepID=A0A317E1J6_9PROT|nr:dTMP kinase [Zavarzinia compransoris]PWR19996.1 dTMP kinase [Zavarzinia compransoris]TDP44886.1 thymidylate kinase [Zavarzinia compransoris]
MPGRFIVLEGGEGAGKTGAIAFLAAELTARGHRVVPTREPGGTPEGKALRALLLSENGLDWAPDAELLLMNADRVQHLERVVRPALQAGAIVISDRYAGSTIAYQGAGRGLGVERVIDLHREIQHDFWPDLTIVLDIPPEVGLARSRARLAGGGIDEGRFEGLDLDFHRRVRQSFLAQAAHMGRHAAVIDATLPPDAVQAAALAAVLRVLG